MLFKSEKKKIQTKLTVIFEIPKSCFFDIPRKATAPIIFVYHVGLPKIIFLINVTYISMFLYKL